MINFNYDDTYFYNLNNELKTIYLYKYFLHFKENIVLVTNTLYEANIMYQSLLNYTDKVLLFPMDDFLTSEAIASSPELKINRLETLVELSKNKNIIITNLMGYLRYIPKKNDFEKNIIKLKISDKVEISDFCDNLDKLGYIKQTIVNKTGEYAKRGYIVDIFPLDYENAIRIEFFDNEIESLRFFDINNQLTISKIKEISIYPITEFFNQNNQLHYLIKSKFNITNISNYVKSIVFFDNIDDIKLSYNKLLTDIAEYNNCLYNENNIEYMFDFYKICNYKEKYFNNLNNDNVNNYSHNLIFNNNIENINKILNNQIELKKTVIICMSNKILLNKFYEELNNLNCVYTNINNIIDNKINLIIKTINQGFKYEKYIVISDKEIFNKENQFCKYKSKFKIGSKIRDINKLNIGDYIVHQKHGIGKYIGIKKIEKNGLQKDYLTIEYRDNDKLYIPVEKLELISKYSLSDGIVPKVNKLGGTEWHKAKIKAKDHASKIANELLKLYSERKKITGFSFKKDSNLQQEFEKEFEYNATIDQIKVTEEIKQDMENNCPMDRLVCGDVGYGKTEVAFRAMFKAICSSKQVALLCPTTILSQQHYKNAINRFKSFPVNICILNRFVSNKQIVENIKKIKEGKIDIIIGTHRILSDDVVYNDLGLLIVDEEQRFGVKHKEKIKKLKNNIDVLTLTATPIPRTLQMSLSGLRGLSLLETPPINRYPVQTYVLKENKSIIKNAIYKELSRNGQVFILYNNINKMDEILNEIKNLVPFAKVVIAHGKMEKNELEDIMYSFINNEYNVMICTTIIETGIDIPNVNTLIIMDADKYGLSQLYQLRGRVGRSNKIAYCYLMYNSNKILSEIATKRLNAIMDFTELGSGYSIAMRDLSIRGAGNILGSEQSGYIDSIGIDLFMKMLNEEIDKLNGKEIDEVNDKPPLIDISTSIDDKYIEEEELKIEIHKMINEIDSMDKLSNTKDIIEDRFGKLPDNLIIYMYEELFEKKAIRIGIDEIKQTKNTIEIYIPNDLLNQLDSVKLFNDLYKLSKLFKFKTQYKKTYIVLDITKLEKHFIYYLIDFLDVISNCKKK